jgi:hypothetical protein
MQDTCMCDVPMKLDNKNTEQFISGVHRYIWQLITFTISGEGRLNIPFLECCITV